ncbi:putative transport protein YhhT [Halomonadaceae bacterium LMG 33818]|uniref:AI-2E family transporter n=1 Tax=Cernens ardua TaxID=3402176 RepID=UPI003EDB9CC4
MSKPVPDDKNVQTTRSQETSASSGQSGRLLVVVAALFIIIGGLKLGSDLVIPILLSLFVAVLLAQPTRWLTKKKVPPTLAVLIVIVVACVLFGLVSLLIGSQLAQFSDQMPMFAHRLSALYNQGLSTVQHWGLPVDRNEISQRFDPSQLVHYVPSLLSSVGSTLSQTVVIIIMAVFMIFEILDFPKKLSAAFSQAENSIEQFTQFSNSLTRYLIVKCEVGLICGVATTIACWCLGVQFALIWGVLAFMLNFIPNIGAFLSAIPPVLLTLVMPDGGFVTAIILAAILFTVHFTAGNLIEPRLMGHALGISTLMAFMSLIIWGWILGPIGLILSVPLTMSLKIVCECHPSTRWFSVMIGPADEHEPKKKDSKNQPGKNQKSKTG